MFRRLILAGLLAGTIVTAAPSQPADAGDESFRYFAETGHYVKGEYLEYFDRRGGVDVLGMPRTADFRERDRLVQYFQNVRLEWDCGENGRQPCALRPGTLGELILGRSIDLPDGQPLPQFSGGTAWYFPESNQTVQAPFLQTFVALGGVDFFGYPLAEAEVVDGRPAQWFQRARLQLDPDGVVRLSPIGDFYIDTLKRVSPVYLIRQPAPAPATPIQIRGREPQGKLVFQTRFGGDIIAVNADGTGQRRITDGAEPTLSPTGREIAFTRWRDPAGLYVRDLVSGEERLIFAENQLRGPSWSPDGSRIAFLRPKEDPVLRIDPATRRPQYVLETHWSVAIIDAGGGAITDLPSQTFSNFPSWSPDGKRIVFDGNNGLYLVSVDAGSPPVRISGTNTGSAQPAWSPNGQLIAFAYRRAEHWDIAVISPNGGGVRLVTDSPIYTRASNNVAPSWSPDGTQIVFLSDRDGSWQLYSADLDGRNVRPVFTGDRDFTFQYADERVVSWGR